MIASKWKIFSIRHCFSNDMLDEQCVEHFDKLVACEDNDDIENYIAKSPLIIWHPFEFMYIGELFEHVVAMAKIAQATEACESVVS